MRRAVDTSIDRYKVEGFLGEGGMGEVYAAFDPLLRRRVALKLLHPRSGGAQPASARLLREARAVAAFSHPNVVAIHDVIEVGDQPCLVMELVEGRTLRAQIGNSTIPLARRLTYLEAIARALDAAHRRGLVHRDLKPDNVMVQPDDTIKVLDFGIAKWVTSPEERGAEDVPASTRTADGKVSGTPAYMAPEQAAGWAVDARADQFAWGVLAVELLTGVRPTPATSTAARTLLTDRGLPRVVVETITRALSRLPADRLLSMEDIAAAFSDPGLRVDGAAPSAPSSQEVTTVDAGRPTTQGEAPSRERPRWKRVAIPAAVALALGAGGIRLLTRSSPVTAAFAETSVRTVKAGEFTSPPEVLADVATTPYGLELVALSFTQAKAVQASLTATSDVVVRPVGGGPLDQVVSVSAVDVGGRINVVRHVRGAFDLLQGHDDTGSSWTQRLGLRDKLRADRLALVESKGELLTFAACDVGDHEELRAFSRIVAPSSSTPPRFGGDGATLWRSERAPSSLRGPHVAAVGDVVEWAFVVDGVLVHGAVPSDRGPTRVATGVDAVVLSKDAARTHLAWVTDSHDKVHHTVLGYGDEEVAVPPNTMRLAYLPRAAGAVMAWVSGTRTWGAARASARW